MSFLQILSGFKGRLARLPYFGYSLLLLVLVLAPVLIGAGLIGMNRGMTDNVIVVGLLIALAIVLGLWCGLALLIKRLHDMGMAGAHAIWIYGIYVVAANAAASEAFGILFNLVSFGIWLWLLFTPGQPQANRYGPAPGPQSGNGLDQQENFQQRQPAEDKVYNQDEYLLDQQENFQQRQPVSTPSVPRPGRLKQRLLLIGLALAVAIGLAVWSMRPVPLKNRAIFEQAIANLAEAQGLRYKDTTSAGNGERDVTVTSSDQQFGSLTWMGLKSEVLRVDGTLYARNTNNSVEPVAGQAPDISRHNRWTLGIPGYNRQASRMLEPFISPRRLANRLSLALKDLPDAPAAYDNIRPDLVVGGAPALRANTAAGILYVSLDQPYRVLRLEPSTAQKVGSLIAGILQQDLNVTDGVDLFPLSDSDAEQMYETLMSLVEQLADVVNEEQFRKLKQRVKPPNPGQLPKPKSSPGGSKVPDPINPLSLPIPPRLDPPTRNIEEYYECKEPYYSMAKQLEPTVENLQLMARAINEIRIEMIALQKKFNEYSVISRIFDRSAYNKVLEEYSAMTQQYENRAKEYSTELQQYNRKNEAHKDYLKRRCRRRY